MPLMRPMLHHFEIYQLQAAIASTQNSEIQF
jgi:hypothetical protein